MKKKVLIVIAVIVIVVILLSPMIYNIYLQPPITVKNSTTVYDWKLHSPVWGNMSSFGGVINKNITATSYITEKGYKNSTMQIILNAFYQYELGSSLVSNSSYQFSFFVLINGTLAPNLYLSNLVLYVETSGFPNLTSDNAAGVLLEDVKNTYINPNDCEYDWDFWGNSTSYFQISLTHQANPFLPNLKNTTYSFAISLLIMLNVNFYVHGLKPTFDFDAVLNGPNEKTQAQIVLACDMT